MIFHALNRGIARDRIFDGDADDAAFERVVVEVPSERRVRILGYCPMAEHAQMLFWPPPSRIDPESIRGRICGILPSLKRPVGERAIGDLREHSPGDLESLWVCNANRTYHRFWQAGSGDDENVSEPRVLHALVDDVHLNPVRRGLVKRAEDWPWSSARDWLRINDADLGIDRTFPESLDIPRLNR